MRFFETICIQNGKIYNLCWHQKRVDYTSKRFGLRSISLARLKLDTSSKSRCKVVYGSDQEIIYSELKSKKIKKLKIFESDMDYSFKFLDRSALDQVYTNRQEADDLIITKNHLIRDTTIANIAFFDGDKWITPRYPLLRGTMRARLLAGGFLQAKSIDIRSVDRLWLVALMNAVTGFCPIGTAGNLIELE